MSKLPQTLPQTLQDDESAQDTPFILVVDDTPDNLEVIRLFLERKGYRTDGARSAAETLQILDRRCETDSPCYDLIILDIDLPDARGGTLANWIREMYPGIPMMLLTGYGRLPAFVNIASALGIPFETKPIDSKRLLALVAELTANTSETRKIRGRKARIPEVIALQMRAVSEAAA